MPFQPAIKPPAAIPQPLFHKADFIFAFYPPRRAIAAPARRIGGLGGERGTPTTR